MKLWQKLSAISISIMLLVMSISIFIFVEIQANSMRNMDKNNARHALDIYCTNVVSAVTCQGGTYQDLTLRSIVQYYFSLYAPIVQDKNTYYSLTSNDRYLTNISPYDPAYLMRNEYIPDHASAEPVILRFLSSKGEPILIGGCSFTLSSQEFKAYISVNTSETEEKIFQMRMIGSGTLILACIFSAVLTALFLKKATKPISALTQTAKSIAGGNYKLRTAYMAKDEIGQLSMTFDEMAQSIEDNITRLNTELKRRQFLIGALSHEIKTPMTSVIGYAETLLRMPLNKEQQIICADKIAEAGRRGESLSQKMMELTGLSAQNSVDRKLFHTEKLVNALKNTYPDSVEFHYETDLLYGDETLLYSLVSNLIQNALRASAADGRVKVSFLGSDDKVRIEVADCGCGIPKEHIPLLTEPFYQIDKSRSGKNGGAGLGLAICKLIADWHDGTLTIESTVGKGTSVRVTIASHTT